METIQFEYVVLVEGDILIVWYDLRMEAYFINELFTEHKPLYSSNIADFVFKEMKGANMV